MAVQNFKNVLKLNAQNEFWLSKDKDLGLYKSKNGKDCLAG